MHNLKNKEGSLWVEQALVQGAEEAAPVPADTAPPGVPEGIASVPAPAERGPAALIAAAAPIGAVVLAEVGIPLAPMFHTAHGVSVEEAAWGVLSDGLWHWS